MQIPARTFRCARRFFIAMKYECLECEGTGEIEVDDARDGVPTVVECFYCSGSGEVDEDE